MPYMEPSVTSRGRTNFTRTINTGVHPKYEQFKMGVLVRVFEDEDFPFRLSLRVDMVKTEDVSQTAEVILTEQDVEKAVSTLEFKLENDEEISPVSPHACFLNTDPHPNYPELEGYVSLQIYEFYKGSLTLRIWMEKGEWTHTELEDGWEESVVAEFAEAILRRDAISELHGVLQDWLRVIRYN